MKRIVSMIVVFMLTVSVLNWLAGNAAAQLLESYLLRQSTLSSTTSSVQRGAGYTLSAVVGQPVTGESSGAGYTLQSGYAAPSAEGDWLYIPLIAR